MLLTTTTAGGCPLCGAHHAICGPPSAATPVDLAAAKESTVATEKYRVTVNGHQTTMKLSADDAKAYPDAVPVDEPHEPDPAPVPVLPDESEPDDAKARTAANKARRPAGNKTEK